MNVCGERGREREGERGREREKERERERGRERDGERERERERERDSKNHIHTSTHITCIKKAKLIDEINEDGRAKKYTNMNSRENNRRDASLHPIFK